VRGFTGACPASPCCGNPNSAFEGLNLGEPCSFLNVHFTDGVTYDHIRIFQIGGGGYESDNHTVGFFTRPGGMIPEPATWAMMIAGFGLVGFRGGAPPRTVRARKLHCFTTPMVRSC